MKRIDALRLPPGRYSDGQVLGAVIRRIQEEPKRLNMRWFIGILEGEKHDTRVSSIVVMPACGTVACIAGWINLIAGDIDGRGSDDYAAIGTLGLPLTNGIYESDDTPEQACTRALKDLFWSTYISRTDALKRLIALRAQFAPVLDNTFTEVA